MTKEYGQFCGLAHALDLIGARWTLLIVRDLLTGPKRFTDLEQGLPGIPSNILSTRLREMEDAGIIERRILRRPMTGVAYALTPYGQDLEEPLLRLGLWGARSLDVPKPGDFISGTTLALGLRSMFDPAQAADIDLSFALHVNGERFSGSVHDGRLTVPEPIPGEPDLEIRAEPAVLGALFRRLETVEGAVAAGRFPFEGTIEDARRFFSMFSLPERVADPPPVR